MSNNNDAQGKRWLKKSERPIIIAGPCSAETEYQTLETAKQLKQGGHVDIFRAGIWKPRTRPNSFEGVGKKGLPWLKKVKEETDFPVTVEVANGKHVEYCLEAGIDILWIGARTTVNPFNVQEIANALSGVNIPVLVKNPINPDLSLWLGAIERLEKSGINEIGGIHRGFSYLGEQYYRNRPQWQIALEFKKRRNDIPLLNDPSHICGRRDILHDVAQKAMDLNFDGLMIETHIDPDNALSDANQQITPSSFDKLISDIIFRIDYEDVQPIQDKLDELRTEIDHIDDELMSILSNRMNVVRKIGAYKKANNVTILQEKRWQQIIERNSDASGKLNISKAFVVELFQAIHNESIGQQEKVFKGEKD